MNKNSLVLSLFASVIVMIFVLIKTIYSGHVAMITEVFISNNHYFYPERVILPFQVSSAWNIPFALMVCLFITKAFKKGEEWPKVSLISIVAGVVSAIFAYFGGMAIGLMMALFLIIMDYSYNNFIGGRIKAYGDLKRSPLYISLLIGISSGVVSGMITILIFSPIILIGYVMEKGLKKIAQADKRANKKLNQGRFHDLIDPA